MDTEESEDTWTWTYSKDKMRRYRWRSVNWRGYFNLYLDAQHLCTGDVWSESIVHCLNIPAPLWFDAQGMKIPEFPLKRLPTKF